MRYQLLDVAEIEELARQSEIEAARAEAGPVKADWLSLANSWRLLAERVIAERTGGEVTASFRFIH
jgi:hypothetical protein